MRSGAAAGARVVPFKPAASGPPGPDADPERLAAASSLGLRPEQICPLRYPEPVAPGVAEDPGGFASAVDLEAVGRAAPELLRHVRRCMEALEATTRPDLTLIEGAGGLWVPMPGGTWLPEWIAGLEATPVVVARLGLGTINHTLLTIAALRRLQLAPRGFFMVETRPSRDPSRARNPAIVAAASGVPCLGVLPFDEQALPASAWVRLCGAIAGEREG